MTLTVYYTEPSTNPSTGSLSVSSVNVSGDIKITVSPASSTYTHNVTWSLGNYSKSFSMGVGATQCILTVPSDWANAISGTSASATVILSSYNSADALIGSPVSTFIDDDNPVWLVLHQA